MESGQGFVHSIDPVIVRAGGINCYYYGLAYTLGFLGVHFWLRWQRKAIGWRVSEVYDFSILFSLGVLLGGRAFAVVMYHWDYYRVHISQLLSYWRGGMASHGVLLGAVCAVWLFCWLRGKKFLSLADEVAVPAALFLALGRIGNFINGQICGTTTDLWWGVKFPDVEGFRHPVTLYESLKNFLLIPILLFVWRKWRPGRGMMTAHFVFWYGLLRIPVDCFREHGAELFGIGRNQYFNAAMAVCGLVLILVYARRERHMGEDNAAHAVANERYPTISKDGGFLAGEHVAMFALRRIVFAGLVLFALVVRSAWTPEVLKQRRAECAVSGSLEKSDSTGIPDTTSE